MSASASFLDAPISWYNSAKDKAPSKEITVRELVRIIHEEDHAGQVARVRAAGSEDEKRQAKIKLPAVQISGRVTEGERKQAIQQGRFTHSGFLQLDVDDGGLNGRTPEEARAILAADPHVLSAFITPSGQGAKALFRVKTCATDEDHKSTFRGAEKYIRETYGLAIDPSTKDTGRLCFVPSDGGSTWRHDPAEFVAPAPTPEAPPARKGSSRGFPQPPVNGIHAWLPKAAWRCRFDAMSESDAVSKLESFQDGLRRNFQPHEVADAVRLVYSSPMPNRGFDAPVANVKLTAYTSTDSGNAERVHAVAGEIFRHVSESGQWLLWDGCRWHPDKNGAIKRLFVSTMKATFRQAADMKDPGAAKAVAKYALQSLDSNKVAAGLAMLKSIAGVSISVTDLDSDQWLLGTPDEMIDLRTGQPITPDPARLVTKSIGTTYNPTATCPTWEKFLQTATGGDSEMETYLQSAVGYSLTGSNIEHCLFFLHGLGGNGKGVFSETIKALFGDYGITAPESMFVKDRNTSATNDIARLAGCRLAVAAELEEGACFAESRLKSLTGDDTITARFHYQEFFDFFPTHTFWISGNHKPTIKGTDPGIWRRIRLLPFTAKIPDDKIDRNLGEKLKAELPGILNWALAGCLNWQRNGLVTPKCVLDATADYRKEEDIIGQFLEECTATDTDSRELQSSVFECYVAWAANQGIKRPLTATIFNRKLDERGIERVRVRGGRFWKGFIIEEKTAN